jgi:hypothetical protein
VAAIRDWAIGRAPLSATGDTGPVRVVAAGGATSARGSFAARPDVAATGFDDVGFTGTFFGAGAVFAAAAGVGFAAAVFAAADFASGLAVGFTAGFGGAADLAFGAGFAAALRFAAAGFGAAFFATVFLAFAGFAAGFFAGIYDSICRVPFPPIIPASGQGKVTGGGGFHPGLRYSATTVV